MPIRPGGARGWLSASLAAALAALLTCPGPAAAAPRLHAPAGIAGAARERSEAARVMRYWTPARMRAARPLDLAMDSRGRLALRATRPAPSATASFLPVPTPEAPPFSVNGRIFVRQGKLRGFCSGTAINTPTRQLVLTAGHCVNSGPDRRGRSVWSSFLEFVPGFNGGVAPFGAFVARRGAVYAPRQWVLFGNPDFDMGAFLTMPNAEGLNLADAVGGGATVVTDVSRRQQFQSFGYPGETTHMQTCASPYIGDDTLSYPLPGPPTLAIRCHWAPGASGGAWLIGDGTQIDGMTTYLHLDNRTRTFGPYFSAATVGRLIAGL
jgi:V8-like Glu-specific endopeptidase